MIRLLVVGDDPLARSGLVAVVGDAPTVTLIGQTSASPSEIDRYSADVVLLDLGWSFDDVDVIAEFAAGGDAPRLVVLLGDLSATDAVVAALRTQDEPFAVLERGTPQERLLLAVQSVDEGLIVLDPALNPSLVMTPTGPEGLEPPVDLTPREHEVLNLVAEGLANKAIAQRLGITEYTVKYHVTALMSKLSAASRTEAVVRATRMGLITL